MIEAILDIFKGIVWQCLVIYMYNMIIYSRTNEPDVQYMKKVLYGPEIQMFYLKETKFHFCTRKLEILMHIFTSDGFYVDCNKKTILKFLTPTCKMDLCGFLGVGNYLQLFLLGLTSDSSTLWELQAEYTK